MLPRVAMCCDMLGVVGSNLKMVKFFMQHLWILHDVVVFGQVSPTMLRLGMRTTSIFNSQHVATRYNRVAKRVQHVAPTMNKCDLLRSNVAIVWPRLANIGPTMLRYVVSRCCNCLAGDLLVICQLLMQYTHYCSNLVTGVKINPASEFKLYDSLKLL